MHFPVKRPAAELRPSTLAIDRRIRDFLSGDSDGADLFHALYDHVLDEPVPKDIRALFKH